jgi:hypothetical protein
MIRALIFIGALFCTASVFSQSNLPKCQGANTASWSNCIGSYTNNNGNKYEGEYLNGKAHGYGIYLYVLGDRYVGQWNDGLQEGLGIEYFKDGFVKRSGAWRKGGLEYSFLLDENHFNLSQQTPTIAFYNNAQIALNISRQDQVKPNLEDVNTNQNLPDLAIGKRIALVVGNANYKVRPLKNSRNDADDVSWSLKATGFDVIDLRDATLPQMRIAVRQFGDRLINNDVGLVYYSGHGVEVKGRNYFIPVNADIQREDEIADQGLDVSLILEKMSTAGKGVNILIVDACRDDPFGRSFRSSSRGLANMDAPRGTIIAYATSPGKVASDGDPRERNSPYTKHLVKAMQSPNKPIEQVFKEVRRAVQDETKNQQTPWENTSLSGDFFFRVKK